MLEFNQNELAFINETLVRKFEFIGSEYMKVALFHQRLNDNKLNNDDIMLISNILQNVKFNINDIGMLHSINIKLTEFAKSQDNVE